MALDKHWQSVLEEGANVSAVRAMSIADGEKVAVLQAHDVRVGNIGVLVDFVRVVRRDAALGGKRELGDDVDNLLLPGQT